MSSGATSYELRNDTMASTTAPASSSSSKDFPKIHIPVFVSEWKVEHVIWKVEMTKEKKTYVDKETGLSKTTDEVWSIVPYYKYSDGKEDKLAIQYDAAPVYIMEQVSTYGKSRKMCVSYDRPRSVYHNIVNMCDKMKASVIDFILTSDCSKVLGSIETNIVKGDESVPIAYSSFIKKAIAEGASPSDETTRCVNSFRKKFESVWRQEGILNIPPETDKKPAKWLETTAYPGSTAKPKSDSHEDKAKFATQCAEGWRKLCIFADKDTREKVFSKQYPPEVWVTSAKGTVYTTDWHLMKYPVSGMTSWISVVTLIDGVRVSVSKKEPGKWYLRVEESIQNSELVALKVSDFKPRVSEGLKSYTEEYGEDLPAVRSSRLQSQAYAEDGNGDY